MSQNRRPVMLVVLDGFGWREETADNAVAQARKPTFDRLWTTGPRTFLHTDGHYVGLPDGQMGNSEVGHLNIGAGRVVYQELPKIGAAIADGSLARNPALAAFMARLKETGGACHLMGLVSPGGVHAHQDHAAALAGILAGAGLPVTVHAWTDGRDTPPRSGADDLARLASALPPGATIGTVGGRYYAMDRDKRWERVSKAYGAIAHGTGEPFADPAAVMAAAYSKDVTDEFVLPAVIGGYPGMRDGDGILCFNFRADRVRELLAALLDPAFDGFPRGETPRIAGALGMTEYSADLDPLMAAIFPAENLSNVLGAVVAKAGRTQLRMAETEKYPHVTYFLNGGQEVPFEGEERIMVPSPKVATYDLQPEMSEPALAGRAVEAIRSGRFDLIVLNFANPDMVGHTGSLAAATKAVEAADRGLGLILEAVTAAGGALLVTADHGNCELMKDPRTGGPHTSHTTNPVPAVLAGVPGVALAEGKLADVAPTLLSLMGLPQPPEMTGRSLLRPAGPAS